MMKTTCKVLAGLATLVLALISLWATFNPTPAYAASASGRCSNGTSVSCTGDSCQSQDENPSSNGYCFCSRTGQTPDAKFCSNQAPWTKPPAN